VLLRLIRTKNLFSNLTNMQKFWYYLSKALGSKEGKNDSEADVVAFIRMLLILQAVVTNACIIAGVVRHW
jgi:hypothetical protein